MKKLNIILLIGMLIVTTLVVSIGITNLNIETNQERLDALKSKGIDGWKYNDTHVGYMWTRCLISPSSYNLPCSDPFNFSGLSEQEINSNLDKWQYERMIIGDGKRKSIADIIINRNNKGEKQDGGTGAVTLTAKK